MNFTFRLSQSHHFFVIWIKELLIALLWLIFILLSIERRNNLMFFSHLNCCLDYDYDFDQYICFDILDNLSNMNLHKCLLSYKKSPALSNFDWSSVEIIGTPSYLFVNGLTSLLISLESISKILFFWVCHSHTMRKKTKSKQIYKRTRISLSH